MRKLLMLVIGSGSLEDKGGGFHVGEIPTGPHAPQPRVGSFTWGSIIGKRRSLICLAVISGVETSLVLGLAHAYGP